MSRARIAGLPATLILVLPAFLLGGDRGVNRIQKITYAEEADETVIRVTADETPTFSVFKLDDPVRLFIDVSRGETGPVSNPLVVDNGVVDQIGTLQFKSGGVPVGRVIIGLRDDVPYDVSADGREIVVRVDGQGRRPSGEEARELAGKVDSVRAQLAREKDLLSQVRTLRKQEEALKAREEASRKESERLRMQAAKLQKQSEEKAERASAHAKSEKQRLDEIKEIAAREREAIAAATAAEREKAEAAKRLVARAQAKRRAEEDAAARAEEARKAAAQALVAERSKLESIQKARKAEEAHRLAVMALAERERKNLDQARKARVKEEAIIARLAEARKQEERASRIAAKDKAVAAELELEATRKKVAELEADLEAERAAMAGEARKREQAYKAAVTEAESRQVALEKARGEASSLEAQVGALKAERDRLAAVAKKAKVEAARSRLLAEEAAKTARRKAEASEEAEAVTARLAEKKKELAAIESEIETMNASKTVAAESRRKARASMEETAKRMAEQERRLAQLSEERSSVEASLGKLRAEIADLKARRGAFENAETRKLSKQLDARQVEIEKLEADLATARADTGGTNARADALAARLKAKEAAISKLQGEYEAALTEARTRNEAIKASYEVQLSKARTEADWKDETIKDLADKIARARDEVGESRKVLAQREAEIEKLRASLESSMKTGRQDVEQLRNTLRTKVAEADQTREVLATRLSTAQGLADQRAAKIERLSAELKRIKARGRGQTGRTEELRTRLASREMEIKVLKKAYEDAKRSKKKGQVDVKRVAMLKASLKDQKSEIRHLKAELGKSSRTGSKSIAARDRKIKALTRQIEALKADRAASENREVTKLRKEVARKEARIAELETVAAKAATSDSRMARKMATARKELKSVEHKLARASAREKAAREKELAAATRVESLMKELAEVKSKARAAKKAAAVKKAVAAKTAASRVASSVKAVDFKEISGVPSVVIKVKGKPEYKVVSVNDHTYVLTLKGVTLPKQLARRMDVTAFESPVNMVTSFTDGDGTTQVVADLAEPIGQSLKFRNGALVWKFKGPSASDMYAAAAPTPGSRNTSSRMLAKAEARAVVPDMKAPQPDQPPKYRKPSMVPKKKKYKGKRINLTVKDADIQNVLTFLAREGRINIVTSENVSGKVTFHLEDVPWDLALDTVLKAKGLDYVVEQDIFRVAPVEDIQHEYEARVKKMQKVRELKPVLVRLIPVNYGNGTELTSRVRSVLSDKGVVTVDQRTNTLIIKDTEDYLTAAEELVRRLDQQTPQVLIEARIVEARTTFKEDIGIQWGGKFAMGSTYGNETGLVFPSSIGIAGGADDMAAPQNGINLETPNFAVNLPAAVGAGSGGAIGIQLGSIGGAANLSLRLSAAEEEGDVKIISSPRISTLDNTKATISQGVAIPISVVSAAGVNTQFFSADLKLDVVPHVTRDGHIAMKLDITKNEPDFGNVAANGNPTIQKKEAHTELLIRDGDTTVIGGIYTRSKGTSFKKVPFFGDIPILGWFFKSRTRTDDRSELLIFITPKVVNREVAL